MITSPYPRRNIMDTTQTNREDAARRSRQEVPQSAQQRNGAARTPEEQRSAAARQAPSERRQAAPEQAQAASRKRPAPQQQAAQRKRTAPEQKQAAPRKRSAAEQKEAAPQKRTAPEQQAAPKRRPAPEQKQAAPGKRPASPQKQAAPKKRPASGQRRTTPKKSTDLDEGISSKKRAYGNSKPKKKSALAALMDNAAKAASQRQAAKAKQAQKKAKRPKQPTPAVIYTQPQAFNRNRMAIQLLTVLAVVAAPVLGLAAFFKVETITVPGAEVYSAWTVREASGISEGDNLLTFSHARAGAKIKANLPYVNTVRFGIKLPDTVNIIIEEDDVVYAIQDTNSQWWLMNSGGRVVEQCGSGKASNYTQILGVTLDAPMADSKAVATENVLAETDPTTGELISVPTTTGAQRLTAALEIVRALEENDIVGTAASVDVTTLEEIVLWYGSRYQVNLGDNANLAYKVACMNDVILQLSDFQSGILDISFTIWPDKVVYTPFG